MTPHATDWSQCPDVERIAGKVSGVWIIKGTRIPVQGLLDNAEDLSADEIVAEVYPSVELSRARRILAFALNANEHAPRSA